MSSQPTSNSSPGSPKQSPPIDRRSSLYAALPSLGMGSWYSGAKEQFSVIKMAEGAVKGAVSGVSNVIPEKAKKDMQDMVRNVDSKLGEYAENVGNASGVVCDGVKKAREKSVEGAGAVMGHVNTAKESVVDASGKMKDGYKIVKDKSVEGAGVVMDHVNVARERVKIVKDCSVDSAGAVMGHVNVAKEKMAVKGWMDNVSSGMGEPNVKEAHKDQDQKLSTSSLYQSLPSVPTTWYQDAKNKYSMIQAAEGAVVGAVSGVCNNVPETYKDKAREMVGTADGALGTYVAKPLEKTSGMVVSGAGMVKEGVSGSVEMAKGGINVISKGVEVVKEKVGGGIEEMKNNNK